MENNNQNFEFTVKNNATVDTTQSAEGFTPSIQNPSETTRLTLLLVYALILDVVGFGTCFYAFEESGLFLITSIAYLAAASLSVLFMYRLYKRYKSQNHQRSIAKNIFLVLLALIVGGWGLCWGVIGFFVFLDGGIRF